jgi:hypothetical protein
LVNVPRSCRGGVGNETPEYRVEALSLAINLCCPERGITAAFAGGGQARGRADADRGDVLDLPSEIGLAVTFLGYDGRIYRVPLTFSLVLNLLGEEASDIPGASRS